MNGVLPTRISPRSLSARASPVQRWLAIAILLGIAACSSLPRPPVSKLEIVPLQLPGHTVGLEDIAFLAPTPDLLALDEEMVAFVAQYTGDLRTQRQRLTHLHSSLTRPGMLDLKYDPFAQGSAVEAFQRGTVNCLSYANLFVAMAREAGLNAQYQWVDIRPLWSRMGKRVAVRLHVNVVVKLRGGAEYMADIDPLEPRDITGTHRISDRDAEALHHSNIAMDALSEERLVPAWGHAVRALQLNPQMAHLWVNLGAVYRAAGQHLQAEKNYLHALRIDPRDRSAMNNLMVLYGLQGRTVEQEHWRQQINRYQASNPYYHAWLGDKAGEADDWRLALKHYQRALTLGSEDSRLLYATGLIYSQLEDYEAASRLITQAIEHATLRKEINSYQIQLAAVKRDHMAGL